MLGAERGRGQRWAEGVKGKGAVTYFGALFVAFVVCGVFI